MHKKIVLHFFILSHFCFLAQTAKLTKTVISSGAKTYIPAPDSALFFYKKGVNAFKVQNYRLADSMYAISLEIKAHPNAYFNRASARLQMQDRAGYCENLAFSSGMGDTEAISLFRKHCGTSDSLYTGRKNGDPTLPCSVYYQVSYRSAYMKEALIARYTFNNTFHSFSWAAADDGIDSLAARNDTISNAEFPGGMAEMISYMVYNVNYPTVARENSISGKVFLKFIINTLGYIEDITVLKGITTCPACDAEAIRVVSCMPRWRPAKYKGKPIKSYYHLPLSFRIVDED